ncbi:PQQ-binding-like beta-propeller repeat protein [Nonomuraea dietziae]|uniref:outer membrane protein assembly factor BamB family protein n=1 Tax=Nonomuraea dietziae TaxID=65515 RepID=UPI0031D1DF88
MKTPLAALAAVLATVLATVLLTTAPAQAATCEPPTVERFGPASVTGAIVGASVHEGKAYVVTRGQKPPVLAELDLSTRKVVRSVTLPDAPATGEPEGAWATAVSGGKVYAGTYPVPDLYSFDLATGEVKHLRSFGRNGGFVWSLAAAPDGTLYAGTYPDGRVWEYRPDTGAVRNFGVLAAGERYVRAVAADADNVYAGLLDKGKLVAIDRASGAVRELAQGPRRHRRGGRARRQGAGRQRHDPDRRPQGRHRPQAGADGRGQPRRDRLHPRRHRVRHDAPRRRRPPLPYRRRGSHQDRRRALARRRDQAPGAHR